MSSSISWLFFDVGNTLLHDDFAMAYIYQTLYREVQRIDPGVSFADLMALRERLIAEHNDLQPHWTIGIRYLGPEGWMTLREGYMAEHNRNYSKYHRPAPHAEEVLMELSKDYRLGVAANQVRNCRAALAQFKLLQYLDLVWISEEVGVEKPEPEFFERLLRATRCPAEAAVMIGDRVDYDIRPAKRMGMKTVQAQLKFSLPAAQDEETRLFFDSLGRARIAQVPPSDPNEAPDAVIRSLAELSEAVAGL